MSHVLKPEGHEQEASALGLDCAHETLNDGDTSVFTYSTVTILDLTTLAPTPIASTVKLRPSV